MTISDATAPAVVFNGFVFFQHSVTTVAQVDDLLVEFDLNGAGSWATAATLMPIASDTLRISSNPTTEGTSAAISGIIDLATHSLAAGDLLKIRFSVTMGAGLGTLSTPGWGLEMHEI